MSSRKRIFDVFFSLMLMFFLSILMVFVAISVKISSRGPVLYWSKRIGYNNEIFMMPKFRSMKVNTPALATHMLPDPASHLTPIGSFLRKSSLDELPQLLCILIGDMSVVGPRPALYNQYDLISLRSNKGIHLLKPGLTGLAQISGRDELPIVKKVDFDEAYLNTHSFLGDLKIICKTITKSLNKDGVTH